MTLQISTGSRGEPLRYPGPRDLPWTWRGAPVHGMRRVKLRKLAAVLGVPAPAESTAAAIQWRIAERLRSLDCASGAIEEAMTIGGTDAETVTGLETKTPPHPPAERGQSAGPLPSSPPIGPTLQEFEQARATLRRLGEPPIASPDGAGGWREPD